MTNMKPGTVFATRIQAIQNDAPVSITSPSILVLKNGDETSDVATVQTISPAMTAIGVYKLTFNCPPSYVHFDQVQFLLTGTTPANQTLKSLSPAVTVIHDNVPITFPTLGNTVSTLVPSQVIELLPGQKPLIGTTGQTKRVDVHSGQIGIMVGDTNMSNGVVAEQRTQGEWVIEFTANTYIIALSSATVVSVSSPL